ncbi:major facilitator superfamily transporter [Corynespora cassiicola Philippines]|uniref:Major facilitator superfamily transporter n=1 Tax=Corynespora cassiicola Philippines TaxID=1448308 RepID=A0A2T2P6J7_CORCC|nr:major facilitator superfamily transporter [Corynespora cassiicola Philippines]
MTTTTTTTAIELNPHSALQLQQLGSRTAEVDPAPEAHDNDDSGIPDGGAGWTVLAGCAVIAWWMVGTPYSWGVIQSVLVEEGVSSPSVLSFVGSLSLGLVAALALLNARIMRSFGPRKIAMLGIVLMATSDLLSSWTLNTVGALFATSGVLKGIGLSLCAPPLSSIPAQYFNRKRGLANGIVFAAGGLGGAILSFAIDALASHLGPGWAFRVLALMTITTGLPAAFLIKQRVPFPRSGLVDWRLFKSLTFVAIFMATFVGTFTLYVPPFFIPLYAKSINLSSTTGAGLLAGYNFASAVGRVGCGHLCDRIGPLNVFLMSMILTSLSMLALWPVSTSLVPMVAFVVVNGISNGSFFSTLPTVVGNVFGSARLSVTMGMFVTGYGGGYLMGAPIAGYILDAYGGADSGFQAYRPAMYYAGSLAISAAGLIALARFRIKPNVWAKI